MATLLIVEDEELLRKALVQKMTQADYTVLQAENGEEGLKSALENHPDLIILDVIMPKMDGTTMLAKLREDEWGKNVPAIVLTNVDPSSNTSLSTINDTQPSYYLLKASQKLEDLVEKVKEILQKHT